MAEAIGGVWGELYFVGEGGLAVSANQAVNGAAKEDVLRIMYCVPSIPSTLLRTGMLRVKLRFAIYAVV